MQDSSATPSDRLQCCYICFYIHTALLTRMIIANGFGEIHVCRAPAASGNPSLKSPACPGSCAPVLSYREAAYDLPLKACCRPFRRRVGSATAPEFGISLLNPVVSDALFGCG